MTLRSLGAGPHGDAGFIADGVFEVFISNRWGLQRQRDSSAKRAKRAAN